MFTINGDVVTVTTPSDCRWLMVEYQPDQAEACGDGDHREDRRKVKVPATGNMVSAYLPVSLFSLFYPSTCFNVHAICFCSSSCVRSNIGP